MDVSHSVISGEIRVTPLRGMISGLAPAAVPRLEAFLHGHERPFLWETFLQGILRLPACVSLSAAGFVAMRLGRKPAPKFGFSSR